MDFIITMISTLSAVLLGMYFGWKLAMHERFDQYAEKEYQKLKDADFYKKLGLK
jgi:hypothetical protein